MKHAHTQDEKFLLQINDWLDGNPASGGFGDSDGEGSFSKQIEGNPDRRRQFLDHLYLDTTLSGIHALPDLEAAAPSPKITPFPGWLRPAALIAACLTLAFFLWQFIGQGNSPKTKPVIATLPAVITLDSGWQIKRTGNALLEVLGDGRLSLTRGEIFVTSTASTTSTTSTTKPLHIKTPNGEATAKGTQFYIAHHPNQTKTEKTMTTNQPKSKTRVLVLSGIVTLANNFGTVSAETGELAEADAGKSPVKEIVQANSSFAIDLYHTLSKENDGENLFFSPYSVSSALAMLSEAARGEGRPGDRPGPPSPGERQTPRRGRPAHPLEHHLAQNRTRRTQCTLPKKQRPRKNRQKQSRAQTSHRPESRAPRHLPKICGRTECRTG